MNKITYTILNKQLCQPVATLLEICFPDMPPENRYNTQELEEMTDIFPEGTIVALDGDIRACKAASTFGIIII